MKKLLILLSMTLTGCVTGPHYAMPDMELPCEWSPEHSAEFSEASPDCFRWWESFNDPILNQLLDQAANQNLDLHLAMTRILEARMALKEPQASLLPHVDASITYSYVNYNRKTLDRILNTCHHSKGQRSLNLFEAGFDADWELDFFGMAKYRSRALEALAEASEEDFSNVWVTLSAEIARSYIEMRGYQQRLLVLENDIRSLEDTRELTSSLIIGGFVSELDQIQIEDQLNMLFVQRPQIEYLIYRNMYHISILLGKYPRDLEDQLTCAIPLPALPCCRPIGIPSELLRRRPDIRKAERELAAATAQVQVAVAALFPRISLTGFIGEIATACSGGFLGFGGPQVLLPIFNSRMIKEDVCLNKLKVEQASIQYQKTVLGALEETENAIAAFHYGMEKSHYFDNRKNSSQDAYDMILGLYESGLKSYLEVQTAYRSFLSAEQDALQGRIDLLLNYIALYKALGGGWDTFGCPDVRFD